MHTHSKCIKFQSRKLFPGTSRLVFSFLLIVDDIEAVNIIKRQTQEVMLILPSHLTLGKAFTLRGCWRWVGNLCNKISSRRLSYAIHEHTNKWSFENDGEAKRKAEKYALAISEPSLFLFRGELDSAEVRLQLRNS